MIDAIPAFTLQQSGRISQRDVYSNSLQTQNYANNSVTDGKIVSISVDKLIAGTIEVVVDIGTPDSGFLRIDGADSDNFGILMNDGTTNRLFIGDLQ